MDLYTPADCVFINRHNEFLEHDTFQSAKYERSSFLRNVYNTLLNFYLARTKT